MTVAVTILAVGLVGAERAGAGTYVMRSCDVPGHEPAAMGPWLAAPAPNTAMVDACSTGGGLNVVLSGQRIMGVRARAALILTAPVDHARRVITLERVRVWGRARLTGAGGPLYFGDRQLVSADDNVGYNWIAAPPGIDALETPIAIALETQTRIAEVVLQCSPEEDRPARGDTRVALDCNADDQVPLYVRGIDVTLSENVVPSGSVVGGSLLSDQPVSDVRGLEYSAFDEESGVAKIEAVMDGTLVASRDLSGECAYADFTACPTADRSVLTFDTRKVPNGRHTLTLRVVDAAGNVYDKQIRLIDVQNAAAASPVIPIGLGGAGSADLTAAFSDSSHSTLIVPFGRRISIHGRLTGASHSGLAGAQVDVFERSAGTGAKEVSPGHAVTRSDGTFSYELARGRPSRTVRLAYGSVASSRLLNVRVRAASTLKATLHGTLVRFSGRVLSRPIPAAGKLVRLQGKAPGYPWSRPFATLRADRRGHFAGSYRLQAHRPGVRLQIRVVVPTERGYPYLGFRGRPVVLHVR